MQLSARKSGPLIGRVRVPGDKSISHRALILGGMAAGKTCVTGLLEADDVLRTAAALRALGVEIEKSGEDWRITGCSWKAPERALYAGNAGTGVRLLMGAVAGRGITARFDGDVSLRARPMGRILAPLVQMGARATSRNNRLPVTLDASRLNAITYRLPVPSAQIKSAILLAALGASGTTVIEEPTPCRDHTERMLTVFGAEIDVSQMTEGGRRIEISGYRKLRGVSVHVPADPSSAAFPVVAGLIVPKSDVTVEGVLMNPARAGLFKTLKEMGADLVYLNQRLEGGESIADIRVRYSILKGIEVPAARAPSMIDEYPVLAMAAATANGTTRMLGLDELRVKESDRLAAVASGLAANGVLHEVGPDWISVTGGTVRGGGVVETHMDHRIAMSFLLLGMVSETPVCIDSADMISTSFPGFEELMSGIGAAFSSG